jgi:hypothetical protein
LARKNLDLWEQMQAATREAFIGRPAGAGPSASEPSDQDEGEQAQDSKQGK